jgi:hypothetical protein
MIISTSKRVQKKFNGKFYKYYMKVDVSKENEVKEVF